jgi:hypothetical protein
MSLTLSRNENNDNNYIDSNMILSNRSVFFLLMSYNLCDIYNVFPTSFSFHQNVLFYVLSIISLIISAYTRRIIYLFLSYWMGDKKMNEKNGGKEEKEEKKEDARRTNKTKRVEEKMRKKNEEDYEEENDKEVENKESNESEEESVEVNEDEKIKEKKSEDNKNENLSIFQSKKFITCINVLLFCNDILMQLNPLFGNKNFYLFNFSTSRFIFSSYRLFCDSKFVLFLLDILLKTFFC